MGKGIGKSEVSASLPCVTPGGVFKDLLSHDSNSARSYMGDAGRLGS